MSYYQFNYNLFSKSCDGYESDNNSFFQSCNDYDHVPVDAQKHDDLIDPQSFSYNNCNYGFQKEENNIFEDPQKFSKENNQTFKKSIGNKSTGLSEMNDKKGEKVKFLTYKRRLSKKSESENTTNKRIHFWDDPDNIKRILQVHYLTFLIDFANDITKGVLFNEENNIKFFQIDYEIKKTLSNHKIFIGKKYKDIFEYHLSPKNKGNINKYENNHDTYSFVCKKSSLLEEFFEKSYLEIFKEYYFKDKRVINLNGLEILLSEKTGTFNNLLNKGNNSSIKHVFLLIINELYFKIDEKNINDK